MAIARDDRYVTDAQGRALAGALVYYCTQPASTGNIPPSPLATIYTDMAGTVGVNPVVTDGFGHAVAYLTAGVLYTIEIVHPLFGPNPVILADQEVGGGSGGAGYTPFSGVPSGTINGTNRVFTLTNSGVPIPNATPVQITAWMNFPLIQGLGFTVSGNQLTYATAPQPGTSGDSIYASGLY